MIKSMTIDGEDRVIHKIKPYGRWDYEFIVSRPGEPPSTSHRLPRSHVYPGASFRTAGHHFVLKGD